MKLSIIRIIDRGVPFKERLHLKALNDANLTYYVVLSTDYTSPTALSVGGKAAYWFSPKSVKAGDSVVLYTCKGQPSDTKNADGTTTFFLYWGWDSPLWSVTGKCAVVMELTNWMTSPYE